MPDFWGGVQGGVDLSSSYTHTSDPTSVASPPMTASEKADYLFDGSPVIMPDGTVKYPRPDGSFITYSPTGGTHTFDASGKEIPIPVVPKLPEGRTAAVQPTGTEQAAYNREHPTGVTFATNPYPASPPLGPNDPGYGNPSHEVGSWFDVPSGRWMPPPTAPAVVPAAPYVNPAHAIAPSPSAWGEAGAPQDAHTYLSTHPDASVRTAYASVYGSGSGTAPTAVPASGIVKDKTLGGAPTSTPTGPKLGGPSGPPKIAPPADSSTPATAGYGSNPLSR